MTFSEKIKKLCRTSLLLSSLMLLVNAVYDCLRDGLFGRFLTSYSKEEKLFRTGKVGQFFSRRGRTSTWIRNIRLHLAEFFENSVLLEFLTQKTSYLLGCSLRFYGIFQLTFGIYTILIHYIKRYAFSGITQGNAALIIGSVAIALAIPMMGSRSAVAELLQKGVIPHAILIDIFGIPEERLDVMRVQGGGKYNIAVLVGMVMGILTFFVPPQYIVLAVVCLVIISIVMSYPEAGVLAVLACLPLFTSMNTSFKMMDFAIGITAFAYMGKMIRGKRIIRFSLMDTLVLLFGVMLLFGGLASVGGVSSLKQALHTCLLLLMYFMIVNLIRTPAWLHRAVLAVVGSSTLMAFVGILQYLTGMGSFEYLDSRMFPSIIGRISATFESPNMFAAYLMMLLPLSAAVFVNATSAKSRLVAAGCGIAMIFSLIFTWSRSAWLGALIALLLFFLIYSRKTFCWLLIGGLTVPVWWNFLPESILNRICSIGNLGDSSTYQRVFTWRGSVRMIVNNLFGGVGYGTEAFREVYPQYSFSGLEHMENTNSLYLALLAAVGAFGLLVFLIMLIVFVQHSFEYIGNASEAYSRTFVAAGLAGVLGALVMGLGTDIWYDETVFLTFFTVLSLTCAYIRAGNLIRSRNQDVSGMDVSHAYVDLHFEI